MLVKDRDRIPRSRAYVQYTVFASILNCGMVKIILSSEAEKIMPQRGMYTYYADDLKLRYVSL